MKLWHSVGVISFVTAICGCGGGVEETPPPSAPTLTAPTPVAPPPTGAAPVAPTLPAATTATQQAASGQPWDANSMTIGEPSLMVATGNVSNGYPDERLVAMVPATNGDAFIAAQAAPPVRPTVTISATQKLPTGFKAMPEFGVDESGYSKRILCEKNQSEMVFIPGGVFQMGSDDGPVESRPQHAMFIDPYYIEINETSLEDFQAFREEQKAKKQRIPKEPLNSNSNLKMPVLGVNFADARAYAKWIGADLPTEAEWEKSARGNEGAMYPWGNGRPAWTNQKELQGVQLAGSEPTDISVYGVKDLAGNAREWCLDYFATDAYPKLVADAKDVPRNWTGPRSPTEKSQRVVKGNGAAWKLPHRSGIVMTENLPDVGFRCVLRFYEVE